MTTGLYTLAVASVVVYGVLIVGVWALIYADAAR